ncbi:MAG: polyprenyl synthetase family protein [archaeon]
MDFKEYMEKNSEIINAEMKKFFPKKLGKKWLENALDKAEFKLDEKTLTKSLSEPIWDLLERGGKRWRPSLMMLSFEALGGKNTKKIMPLTVLPEFMHNGSIMVDDIEDSSELRRGKKCTHLLFGQDIAINAGNTMYFLPMILLYRNKLKLKEKTIKKIYDLCAKEMMKLSAGQGMDILWHKKNQENLTEEHYLQMCAYKTGALARLSAKLGAILAEANEKETQKIGKFAESIGIAFQIHDDVLNLVGEEFSKGKGLGEDIHEGKKTLILLHTLRKASKEDKKRLEEIIACHPSKQETINEAIGIMEKYNSIEYAKEKAKNLVKKSWKEAEPFLKKGKAKNLLKEFGNYVIERKI